MIINSLRGYLKAVKLIKRIILGIGFDNNTDYFLNPFISNGKRNDEKNRKEIRFTDTELKYIENESKRFNKDFSEYCRDRIFSDHRRAEILLNQENEIKELIKFYKKQKNPVLLIKQKDGYLKLPIKLRNIIKQNINNYKFFDYTSLFTDFENYYEINKIYTIRKELSDKKDRYIFNYWYNAIIDDINGILHYSDINAKKKEYKRLLSKYYDFEKTTV